MSRRGYKRNSPQSSPVKQQTENFNYVTCGAQFDSKLNFERHNHIRLNQNHSDSKDDTQNVPDPKPQRSNVQRIEIIKTRDSTQRQFNCHKCDFQGTRSKNVSKHVRETSHKSDPLEEKCYTCDKVCANFEEIMQHRKLSHSRIINQCRYYKNKQCRFKAEDCWYTHELSGSETSNAPTNFPSSQKLPPDHSQILDKMEHLTITMNQLVTSLGGGNTQRIRPQGGH